MLSLHFYVDKPNELKSVVMISMSFKGQRLKSSSKISIDNSRNNEICSRLWNNRKERFKSSVLGAIDYNYKLDNLQLKINKLYIKSMKLDPVDQKKFIKENLKLLIDTGQKSILKNLQLSSDESSVIVHFEDMINRRAAGFELNARNGMPFGDSVVKTYKTTFNHLKGFESQHGTPLEFDDIDELFYQDFVNYLLSKGLTNNSVGKMIKIIKVFMRRAVKNELCDNIKFLDFKVWDKVVSSFALDLDEIKAISDLDLSENKNLDISRDLFIVECFTCLRFEDLMSLSPANIDLKKMIISITTHKTKKTVIIPILPFIKPILEKYNLDLPVLSIQNYNLNLKIIGQKAGLDNKVEVIKYYGNKRQEKYYPKYKLLSSTVARRSYITNCFRQGIPAQMTMKTTGHVKLENFMRYEKLVRDEGAERVRKGFEDFEL